MGYLMAVIASVFYSIYVVPKKISRLIPVRYSLFQGLGFFFAALCGFGISRIGNGHAADTFNSPVLLVACLGGVVWFASCTCFLTSIDALGLSRSNQWKNLQGPFGAVFNMLFLAEYLQTNLWFVILASLCILLSAVAFNVRKAGETRGSGRGILFALLAAVGFGIFSLLQKYVSSTGHIYSQQLCTGGFVFLSAAVFLLIRERNLNCLTDIRNRDHLLGVLGGILYFFASFFATRSYQYLPGSVAFTIIQLNSVWTVLIGIFIFREISFRQHWVRIVGGIVMALAGVGMLLLAQR